MANTGFYLLFLAAILNSYAAIASFVAGYTRLRRFWNSARIANTLALAAAIGASILMWDALFFRDFSLAYVYKNSSTDLPWYYTITAFWSSLEGSHMLWTLFLSICSVVCLWTYHRHNEHILPYVSGFLCMVLAWMFYLAITHSDLFALMPFPQQEGRGMNALLQNPYMAIHPPLLFTGYVCLAVPFAYAMAALIYGDITDGWLKTVRRWTLVSWSFLTAAIILGGRWAYVELGWAGYWAWDPVENSSLMPWLLATALLHSLIIQNQTGHLKRLSIVLAILGFFLTFFGTFITRSGVISSVHSFAESPIGPAYLGFLAVLLLGSALIYAWRSPSILPPDADKVWGASKESALVMTLLIVLSFAAIVFVGTLFPIVSEAVTKRRISIQAPYFNAFAPYFGLATIITIAVGNLMRYRKGLTTEARRWMISSAVVAIPLAAFFVWQGEVLASPKISSLIAQIVGMYALAWTLCCLCLDAHARLIRPGLARMLPRNIAYLGAFIAHVGVLIIIFGFLGNYRGAQKDLSMKAGESVDVFGYQLRFDKGINVARQDNVELYVAPLVLSRDGKDLTTMQPARSKYPTSSDLLHEIAVDSRLWRDIYIVLRDFDKATGQQINLQVNYNPTVRFVWLATIIMVIGGLVALFDPYRGDRGKDAFLKEVSP